MPCPSLFFVVKTWRILSTDFLCFSLVLTVSSSASCFLTILSLEVNVVIDKTSKLLRSPPFFHGKSMTNPLLPIMKCNSAGADGGPRFRFCACLTPARPPSTLVEFFRACVWKLTFKKSPPTPQESYPKFWNPRTTFEMPKLSSEFCSK